MKKQNILLGLFLAIILIIGTGAYLPITSFTIGDGANLDAFSRLRVSSTHSLYDGQFTYDLQPLLMEQKTNGSGATIEWDSINRCAKMAFSSTATGGYSYMQSYEFFRYTSGNSQLMFLTFNFHGGKSNITKFVGYSDGVNGIELRMNGTTPEILLRSRTYAGNQTITQSNWNVDKLDGTGISGLTFDASKTNIFCVDFQALYVGRLRLYMDIGGVLVLFHEIQNANIQTFPYTQTMNLPIRVGMSCTGTVTDSMRFICSTVKQENGEFNSEGYFFSQEGTVTASSGARTHLLSLQPRLTFNNKTNRAKFVLGSVNVANTGSNPIKWELCIGDAITGTTTFTNVNTTYSTMAYNTAGTTSGSPAIVIASGYVSATNTVKGSSQSEIQMKYPITLDASGAARVNGRLTLLVTGIGGTSACRGSIDWKEIR